MTVNWLRDFGLIRANFSRFCQQIHPHLEKNFATDGHNLSFPTSEPLRGHDPPTQAANDPSGLGSLWDRNSYLMGPSLFVLTTLMHELPDLGFLEPSRDHINSGSTPSIKFDDLASPYNDVRSIFRISSFGSLSWGFLELHQFFS